jgi:hypothetical protein
MWSNVNYPNTTEPIKSWTDDALSVVPLCPQFEGQAMELFDSDQVTIVVAGMESSALAKKLCAELNAWVGLRAYLLSAYKYKLERHPELGLGYFEELFHRASRVIKVGELSHARVVEMWNNYGLPDMPEEQRTWIECSNECFPSPIFEDKARELFGDELTDLVVSNFQLPGRVKGICDELSALVLFESWLEEHFEYDLEKHGTLGRYHFTTLFTEAADLLQTKAGPSNEKVMQLWNSYAASSNDPKHWREQIVHSKSGLSLQAFVGLHWGEKARHAFFSKSKDTLELQSLYAEVRLWMEFREHVLKTHGYILEDHDGIGFEKLTEWVGRIVKIQTKPLHRRDRSPARRSKLSLNLK